MPIDNNRVREDPYRALNLPRTATAEEIKKSYRQLAKKYHPDTWSAPCFTNSERKHATSIFQKVSDAHALLGDPSRKAKYDRDCRLGVYPDYDTDNSGREDNHYHHHNSSSTNKKNREEPPPLVSPPSQGAPPPLPRGWTTATDPSTGSLYYCHVSSGKSSWTHPSLDNNGNSNGNNYDYYTKRFPRKSKGGPSPSPTQKHPDGYYRRDFDDDRDPLTDRAVRTSTDPDTHRCGAILALCLCPPLGVLALYHSVMVERCWVQRKDANNNNYWRQHYENLAHDHSKSAAAAAGFGNALGLLVCIYLLFVFDGGDDNPEGGSEWQRKWKEYFDGWFSDNEGSHDDRSRSSGSSDGNENGRNI